MYHYPTLVPQQLLEPEVGHVAAHGDDRPLHAHVRLLGGLKGEEIKDQTTNYKLQNENSSLTSLTMASLAVSSRKLSVPVSKISDQTTGTGGEW